MTVVVAGLIANGHAECACKGGIDTLKTFLHRGQDAARKHGGETYVFFRCGSDTMISIDAGMMFGESPRESAGNRRGNNRSADAIILPKSELLESRENSPNIVAQ